MGDILNTGLVLLVLGIIVVFTVLLFLMFVMEIMSKIVNSSLKTRSKSAEECADEEELAVIMSVLSVVNPGINMANIQVKSIR